MPALFSNDEKINLAYAHCRHLTKTHAKTFYFASHTLPIKKRNACFAVYAFCRYIDDLVDVAMESGEMSVADTLSVIQSWQHALASVYAGQSVSLSDGTNADAILLAWEDTLRHFQIPYDLPGLLIEGVLMDTSVSRFASFNELYEYSYKVASVVGLMTTEIFGYSDPSAREQAVDLGIAMQLTNILRDVKEDAARGRIYLPLDEMRQFGVTEHNVLNAEYTPAMRALLAMQAKRAKAFYTSAAKGIPKLSADCRLTVYLMSMNYEKILDVIVSKDYDVFSARVTTSLAQKLASVPRAWWFARRPPNAYT